MKSCTRIDCVMRRFVTVLPRIVNVFAAVEAVFTKNSSPTENVSVGFVLAIPVGVLPVV